MMLTFLPKIFGKDIRRIVMNKSYRNTIEIASYANKLGGSRGGAFERHGKPVEEKEFTGLTEALERVVKELRLRSRQWRKPTKTCRKMRLRRQMGLRPGRSFLTRQQR